MKTAIVTMGFGARLEAMKIMLPSVESYSNKCNSDLVVLAQEGTHRHPHCHKFEVVKLLDEYDKICFIDADAIVLPTCPDIFKAYPDNVLVGWDECEVYPVNYRRGLEAQKWVNKVKVKRPRKLYINTGVTVIPRAYRKVYEEMPLYKEHLGGSLPEQNWFNAQVQRYKYPVTCMNRRWNYNGHAGFDGFKPEGAHIVHFTGCTVDMPLETLMRSFMKEYCNE